MKSNCSLNGKQLPVTLIDFYIWEMLDVGYTIKCFITPPKTLIQHGDHIRIQIQENSFRACYEGFVVRVRLEPPFCRLVITSHPQSHQYRLQNTIHHSTTLSHFTTALFPTLSIDTPTLLLTPDFQYQYQSSAYTCFRHYMKIYNQHFIFSSDSKNLKIFEKYTHQKTLSLTLIKHRQQITTDNSWLEKYDNIYWFETQDLRIWPGIVFFYDHQNLLIINVKTQYQKAGFFTVQCCAVPVGNLHHPHHLDTPHHETHQAKVLADHGDHLSVIFDWDQNQTPCPIKKAEPFAFHQQGIRFTAKKGSRVFVRLLEGDWNQAYAIGAEQTMDQKAPLFKLTGTEKQTMTFDKSGLNIQTANTLSMKSQSLTFNANNILQLYSNENATFEADQITLTAKQSISLEAGDSRITLTPDHIKIESSQVNFKT